MEIIYGMPTLIQLDSIEENVRLCNKLNLKFLELNMNMPYCFPENNRIKQLNFLREEYNIDFTMHFPEEIDFASFYDEIHEANIALFKRYVRYAYQIGVKKINVHFPIGTKVTLPDKKVYVYENYKEKYYARLKKSFQELVKIVKPYNIKICVENVKIPLLLAPILLKLKEIEDLYFTYDIGHDAESRYSVSSIYQQLDERVSHMHLHDYDKVSSHQILFSGIINLYEKLEFAKKNNMTVVIEVKTVEALTKSVQNLVIRHLK